MRAIQIAAICLVGLRAAHAVDPAIVNSTMTQAAIQAALDAGSVAFEPGIYEFPLQPEGYVFGLQRSNATITIPAGVTIRLAPGQIVTQQLGSVLATRDAIKNVTIRGGGTIDGNNLNQPYRAWANSWRSGVRLQSNGKAHENVEVIGITIKNVDGDGIFIGGYYRQKRTVGVCVRECKVQRCGEGILLHFCRDYSVRNNRVEDCQYQDGIETSDCHHGFIVNNYVRNTLHGSSLDFYSDTQWLIASGNICVNHPIGVTIGGGVGSARHIDVRGNIFSQTATRWAIKMIPSTKGVPNKYVRLYNNAVDADVVTLPSDEQMVVRNNDVQD